MLFQSGHERILGSEGLRWLRKMRKAMPHECDYDAGWKTGIERKKVFPLYVLYSELSDGGN